MQYPFRVTASVLALAFASQLALADSVRRPPLPPGSEKVRVEPGLQESERKKQHRQDNLKPGQQHKDFNVDDSDPTRPDSTDVETKAERLARTPPAANKRSPQ